MPDWQTIIALGCVAAAALYLLAHMVRRATKRTGCGGCETCPSNSANVKNNGKLISLDTKLKRD